LGGEHFGEVRFAFRVPLEVDQGLAGGHVGAGVFGVAGEQFLRRFKRPVPLAAGGKPVKEDQHTLNVISRLAHTSPIIRAARKSVKRERISDLLRAVELSIRNVPEHEGNVLPDIRLFALWRDGGLKNSKL
jgi:hypothetical protein